MQFGSTNNNSRDAVNVNTRGIQMSNRDGFVPSTLLLGYWNEMISIKVHPTLEKSQQTESKVFDYEKVVNTAVTLEKAVVLSDNIEKHILPAIESKTEVFKGIPVGGSSLIGVGTKVIDDSVIAYFAIFKNLDEETKKPESSIFYEFKTSYTVDDYVPATGDFNVSQGVQGELMLFLSVLKSAQVGLSNSIAHASRSVDKFFRDRQMNQLEEIGGKLGIQSKGKGNYGGGGNFRSKDIFSGSNSDSQSSSKVSDLTDGDAPMGKLGNISEIDQFMM